MANIINDWMLQNGVLDQPVQTTEQLQREQAFRRQAEQLHREQEFHQSHQPQRVRPAEFIFSATDTGRVAEQVPNFSNSGSPNRHENQHSEQQEGRSNVQEDARDVSETDNPLHHVQPTEVSY